MEIARHTAASNNKSFFFFRLPICSKAMMGHHHRSHLRSTALTSTQTCHHEAGSLFSAVSALSCDVARCSVIRRATTPTAAS